MEQVCQMCGGTTWVLHKDKEGREIAIPCACRPSVLSSARLRASGINEAIKKKSFATFDTKSRKELMVAYEKAKDYVQKFEKIEHDANNSVLFMGQVGCGKTHLSFAIAGSLMEQKNVGVEYMPYKETVTALKQLEKRDKFKYEAELHRFTFARLLVIDDLFKGKIDEQDIDYMFQIINTRYLNHLPFICSTEKSPHQLINIDEGIASRMIEQATGHSVFFDNDMSLNYRINEGRRT